MSRYITENERYIIETMLKDKKRPKEIAERIGKHYTTVYREIKKGTVMLRDSATWKDIPTYCADAGQRIMEEKSHNKGLSKKVTDVSYLTAVKHCLKDLHYSPYATTIILKQAFPEVSVCHNTIYNYIKNKYIKGVSLGDLPYHKSTRQTASAPRRPSLKLLGAKSIEERPKAVYGRDSFGNWEMDTVVGAQGKSKECLLVLTERKERLEIIRKIPDRRADTVVSELDKLERQLGIDTFRDIFKTITCDNGVEFSHYEELERSITGNGKRTAVYFCHAYCSSERGTNENTNKLIRYFVPKGCMIEDYSHEDIQQIENIINNYPRKLFGGLSALEHYQLSTIP